MELNKESDQEEEKQEEEKEEEKEDGFSFCADDQTKVEKQTSSVLTSRLLDAAHGEIGTVTDTNKDHGDQSVASPSCVVPYHEGIRSRIESFATSLMSTIKSQLQRLNKLQESFPPAMNYLQKFQGTDRRRLNQAIGRQIIRAPNGSDP